MGKATCIHICAAKNSADVHNKREKELDYVREELEKDLPPEKWRWEDPLYKSVAALRKQCEKEYYAKELTVAGKHGTYITHRAMPKTAEPVKEGVVVIKPDTTMEQLREFADWCHGKYGIKPMGIYIHYGEGHWATLDEKAGQSEDGYRRDDGVEWKDKTNSANGNIGSRTCTRTSSLTGLTTKRADVTGSDAATCRKWRTSWPRRSR